MLVSELTHSATGFFSPEYSGFPIHPLGCLELEAFFLFHGWTPPPIFFSPPLICIPQFISPPPPPFFLCVTLLCHLRFTSYIYYIIPITCHCHANSLPSTGHCSTSKKISGLALHLIFHHFSPFYCCLSVVLWLVKGDYPKNLHAVFCPNKQYYCELFMCLDLVLECWQSFLFQIFQII